MKLEEAQARVKLVTETFMKSMDAVSACNFNCPSCKRIESVVNDVLKKYGTEIKSRAMGECQNSGTIIPVSSRALQFCKRVYIELSKRHCEEAVAIGLAFFGALKAKQIDLEEKILETKDQLQLLEKLALETKKRIQEAGNRNYEEPSNCDQDCKHGRGA